MSEETMSRLSPREVQEAREKIDQLKVTCTTFDDDKLQRQVDKNKNELNRTAAKEVLDARNLKKTVELEQINKAPPLTYDALKDRNAKLQSEILDWELRFKEQECKQKKEVVELKNTISSGEASCKTQAKQAAKLKSKVEDMELRFQKLNEFFSAKSVAFDAQTFVIKDLTDKNTDLRDLNNDWSNQLLSQKQICHCLSQQQASCETQASHSDEQSSSALAEKDLQAKVNFKENFCEDEQCHGISADKQANSWIDKDYFDALTAKFKSKKTTENSKQLEQQATPSVQTVPVQEKKDEQGQQVPAEEVQTVKCYTAFAKSVKTGFSMFTDFAMLLAKKSTNSCQYLNDATTRSQKIFYALILALVMTRTMLGFTELFNYGQLDVTNDNSKDNQVNF